MCFALTGLGWGLRAASELLPKVKWGCGVLQAEEQVPQKCRGLSKQLSLPPGPGSAQSDRLSTLVGWDPFPDWSLPLLQPGQGQELCANLTSPLTV